MVLRRQPLVQPVPKRSAVLAALFGFALGPFGLFYVGWRYGLSAVCFTLYYVVFMSRADAARLRAEAGVGIVPDLLYLAGTAAMAAALIRTRGRAIERGDERKFRTLFSEGESIAPIVGGAYALVAFCVVSILAAVGTAKWLMHGSLRQAIFTQVLAGLGVFNIRWVVGYMLYIILILYAVRGCEFLFCRKTA